MDMSDTLSAPAKAKCKTPGKGSKAGPAASDGAAESKKRFEVKKVHRHFGVLDRLAWL